MKQNPNILTFFGTSSFNTARKVPFFNNPPSSLLLQSSNSQFVLFFIIWISFCSFDIIASVSLWSKRSFLLSFLAGRDFTQCLTDNDLKMLLPNIIRTTVISPSILINLNGPSNYFDFVWYKRTLDPAGRFLNLSNDAIPSGPPLFMSPSISFDLSI